MIYFLEQIEKWLTFNLSGFEFQCDLLSLFQTIQSVLFSFILKDCTNDRRPCIFHAAETKSNRLSEKAHRISHEDNYGSYVSLCWWEIKTKPNFNRRYQGFSNSNNLTAVEHFTTERKILQLLYSMPS